jgi:hypothetical protein
LNKVSLPIILAILFYGCSPPQSTQMTFDEGFERLVEIDKSYGVSLKSPPETAAKIEELVSRMVGFQAVNVLPKSLESLIKFRLKFLEAEKLHAEGWQWGRGSTTEFGFGCKSAERIKESAKLRNMSAQKGKEAVGLLQAFLDTYPIEAKSLNLTQKDVLTLKATYFQTGEKAQKDAAVIRSLCKDTSGE